MKHIDLGFSNQLIKVPDLSKAPKLESINVESCPSLLEVPPLNFKISYEHKCQGYCDHTNRRHLGSLTLDGCTNFRTLPEIRGNIKYLDLGRTAIEELPSSIESFENLITLQLFDCRSLKFLPNLPRNIEILQLSGLTIEEVPSSIGCLHNLRQINLYRCKRLKSLPANICKLKFLRTLTLTDCSRLRNFSETLSLEGARIGQELPASSIENTFGLLVLCLGGCKNLESVPYNWLYNSSRLQSISLNGCLKIEHFQTRLLSLYSLTEINLNCCNILEIPNWFCLLSSLTKLSIGGNPFDSIPSTIKQLHQLTTLETKNCINLRSLPELLPSIRQLNASGCTSLETFSDLGDARALLRSNGNFVPLHKFLFYNCLKLDQNSCNNFNDFLYAVELKVCDHFLVLLLI